MLSTVYTMSDNAKAWELINSRKRPCPGRDESLSVVAPSGGSGGGGFNYSRDDSLCVVASSGRSNGRGFMYGYGEAGSVIRGLQDMSGFHKAKVSIGGLEVESTASGAAHVMFEMNPFNIVKGNPVKIADLEAKVADNARYIAGLENALAELGKKNDVLVKDARDDKAVVTKLTETVQELMDDVKVHETKAGDDKDVINNLTTALRIYGRQGKEAGDDYTIRSPKIHAMLRDDKPWGV